MTSFTRLLSDKNLKDLTDSQSGFRAYSRKVLENVRLRERGMGVDSEILISIANDNIRVTEIPISVIYVGNMGSTYGPIHHGLDVFYSLFKIAFEQKPLAYFGLPGLLMILVSILMGVRVLSIFWDTGIIATGSALISVGLGVIGFLVLTTAIILQVMLNKRK
tara:strand:- start:24 stop:512 length:489 start_codon:yes stop_codon:yes gene_type:complete